MYVNCSKMSNLFSTSDAVSLLVKKGKKKI